MKQDVVYLVLVGLLSLLMVSVVSGEFYSSSYSSQYQASSGCQWIPGYGTVCGASESFSEQSSSTYSGMGRLAGVPLGGFPMTGWGGNYFESRSSWDYGGWIFMANGSQMQDVTGVWKTDLLGDMNLKLTGDDIIRGSYVINNYQGYVQGNFSATNSTLPMMDGIWWEEPTYQPPYSAGVMQITFLNDTALSGVFSYSDGTWGPFNGTKISGNLTEEDENILIDMPKVNWTLNYNEPKDYIVSNPLDTNPIMKTGKEVSV